MPVIPFERPKSPLAQAIERHKAAQATIDAFADTEDGYPEHLGEAEFDAIDELAETPCASDAEFLEKLRYLLVCETAYLTGRRTAPTFRLIIIAVIVTSALDAGGTPNDAPP